MKEKISKHYTLKPATIEQINSIQWLFRTNTSRHIFESEIVMIAINELFHNLNWENDAENSVKQLKQGKLDFSLTGSDSNGK